MSKLSEVESNELNLIKKAFKKQLNNLGLKTLHKSILKTEAGYTFRRFCRQNKCGASVYLKLNVSNWNVNNYF